MVPGGYGITIKGYTGEIGSSSELTIELASGSPISTGTYSGMAGAGVAIIHYHVYNYLWWDEYISITSSVTLTELDSEHVKGTFSGTVRYNDVSKELTGGVFNVSY